MNRDESRALQKAALAEASYLVSIVKMGRNQYVLQYPWRGHSGPVTTSCGSYDYFSARQLRAAMVAQYALEILRPDCDSNCAIYMATNGDTCFGTSAEILARAMIHVES